MRYDWRGTALQILESRKGAQMSEQKLIVLRRNPGGIALWPEYNERTGELLVFRDLLQARVYAVASKKYDPKSKFFIAAIEEV